MAEEALEHYEKKHGVDDELTLERMLLRAESGDIEPIEKFFRARVENKHPDAPLILETLARAFLRNYRLREAETCLDRWREIDADNIQALLLRGMVCEVRQMRIQASDYYRRVVVLDAKHDDARLRLARLLVDLGQASEALPHLEYLQSRFPDDSSIAVYRARSLELLGKQEEAIPLLDALLVRFPQCPEALVMRGRLALQNGQLEEAEKLLRQGVDLDPGTYAARFQLHTCLTRLGKMEEAREESNRLKQMEEDMRVLEQMGGGKMQLTPHDPALHVQVAQIALRTGQLDEAVRWLHNALREDPNYAPAHQMLAAYYQRVGKPVLASQHRQRARAASSNDSSPQARQSSEPRP
jgi:tetratricopeptide (TPR) repeat protein